MTPEQIERIRKAAEELEAALNAVPYIDIRVDQRILENREIGVSYPRLYHTLHLTAFSQLQVFP